MHFVKNEGQTDKTVEFISRGPGYTLFLTSTQAVLSLTAVKNGPKIHGKESNQRIVEQTDLQMNLVGANAHPVFETTDQLPGKASYFLGNRAEDWHVNVPMFARVKYHEVYPGISLVYYGNQRQLEYDFVAAPHADPRRILLSFPGADKLELAADGDLLIQLPGGSVRWHKPVAYQLASQGRREIPAHFILKQQKEVGFEVASYDRSLPLVIDPSLAYATYLGGSGNDYSCGIAVDSSGNIYVAGNTSSLNFPVQQAYDSTSGGGLDAFITKLNNNGTALLYSTYLGGNGNEIVEGLALDSSGNAYVAGTTDSPNFPTKNAAYSGNAGFNDAFIAKLGPFGTNLLYASYLGGNGDDSGNAIAVDNAGNAYLAGDTFSVGTGNGPFPTVPNNTYQGHNGGGRDAFVAKFNTTLSGSSSLVYSTFLGGSTDEKAYGVAVDSSGNAVVVGDISSYPTYPTPPSSDFPLMNAFQSSFNQGNLDPLAGNTDAFVTKLNSTGTGLIFSTFLGGLDNDTATGITIDNTGKIYVLGESSSTNFPVTVNAVQPSITGGEDGFPAPDAFIAVFQSTGASLYYSTFLGGSGYESGFATYHGGIAVDRFGDIYIAGYTDSIDDFPITAGADQIDPFGPSDAFIAKINPTVPGAPGLVYSTFLGGDSDDRATSIAVDNNGVFYVTGFSTSVTNLATSGVYRGTNSGNNDVFIAKFTSPPDLSVSMIPSLEPVTVGTNLTYSIQINNNGLTTFSGVTNIVQFSTNVSLKVVSSSKGNFSTNGNRLIFVLGALTNNESVSQTITIGTPTPVLMTNTATLTALDVEPNTDNNLATVISTIRGISDVRLSAATGAPEPVALTSNVTYTIVVNNKGPYAASSIELVDVLPDSVAFVSATNTQGTCLNFSGVIVCDFNILTNNASGTVTIVAKALTTGVSTNFVTVTALELDTIPGNNSANILTTINPLSELIIGQTGPSSGTAGNNITYTLNVTNKGPSTANTVTVTDVIPGGAAYISASNPLGTVSQNNGIVTCTIPSLASNATATITVTVQPLSGGPNTNIATIASSNLDPSLANNSASLVTAITPSADVGISQIASPGSGQVLSNFIFSITVTNRGPSSAANVSVSDPFPSAFSISSITSPGASCSQANGLITCNFGTLAKGDSATLTINAQARLDGVFNNTATLSSSTPDPNTNNSAGATVTITPNPNAPLLKITRSGGQVVLSWATNATGFTLQSRPNLSNASEWTSVINTPTQVGNLWMVTNNVNGTENLYRLIRNSASLSVIRVGNRVVVFWPSYVPSTATLKATTDLISPITWSDVGITPVLINQNYYVTNPINERSFYILFN